MRVLVHLCCGPCAITVLEWLMDQGHAVTGLFFNPNIHPLAEYLRRREGAIQVSGRLGVELILADTLPESEQAWDDPWLARPEAQLEAGPEFRPQAGPKARLELRSEPLTEIPVWTPATRTASVPLAANPAPWLRAVSGREGERCRFCWRLRLRKTAALAAEHGFEAFTTSLLYSRYQNHEMIRRLGFEAGEEAGLSFVYHDFRAGWQQGITRSKEWGIYRQQYCGCVFSEYERYCAAFAPATAG